MDLLAGDASLIELGLALFPWARWQGTQAAVKLNVMLTVAKEIPAFCTLVEGRRHAVNFLADIPVEAGNYYVFDRGYLDFSRLHRIAQAGAWFVICAKSPRDSYRSLPGQCSCRRRPSAIPASMSASRVWWKSRRERAATRRSDST